MEPSLFAVMCGCSVVFNSSESTSLARKKAGVAACGEMLVANPDVATKKTARLTLKADALLLEVLPLLCFQLGLCMHTHAVSLID
jgi:hypothetical protein